MQKWRSVSLSDLVVLTLTLLLLLLLLECKQRGACLLACLLACYLPLEQPTSLMPTSFQLVCLFFSFLSLFTSVSVQTENSLPPPTLPLSLLI